jgi:hypothetical protein
MELANILKGIKYHMLVPFCNHQFHYNLTDEEDNVINDVNYSKINHYFQFGVIFCPIQLVEVLFSTFPLTIS